MARILKRCCSIFLTLLFVFSCSSAWAVEKPEFVKGKRGTFFAVPREPQPYENMASSFTVAWQAGPSTDGYGNVMTSTPAQVAQLMKSYLLRQPEGRRAVRPTSISNIIVKSLDTEVYWYEKGMAEFNNVWEEIFHYYKRIGGPDIDYFFMDFEDGCDLWNMENRSKRLGITVEELYDRVIEDPRYPEVRQSLIDYGIEMYEGDDHNELYYMWANINTADPNTPEVKNAYLGLNWAYKRRDEALASNYELVKKYFPNVQYMNYGSSESGEDPNKAWSEHAICYGWFSPPALPKEERTHERIPWAISAFPTYGTLREANLMKAPPNGYHPYGYKSTPFNAVLFYVKKVKNTLSYMDDSRVIPFVCSYSYSYLNLNPYATSNWYDEHIFHMALATDARGTLAFYNTEHWQKGIDDDLVLSELLYELDEVAGFPDREPVTRDLIPWTTHIMVSGVSAGGRNVFRVTPDLFVEDMTMEKVLVSDDPPVFRIANETVTFPEGSYIYEPENPHSDVGFWVISPEGTLPETVFDESKPYPAQSTYQFGGKEELDARVEAFLAGNLGTDKTSVRPIDLSSTMKRYSDLAVINVK